MRKEWVLQQPHIKAKILGIILIFTGILLVISMSDLYIKLGFSAILIGVFMIIMITEKTVPENISNAQIKGHIDAVKQITSQLNLRGNAVFLPKSNVLTEERVFIPLQNGEVSLPDIDDEFVFATGNDSTSLGLALPPSGLSLLNEVEKDTTFENTDIDNVEEKLQSFVGMDILKSISLKKTKKHWELILEKPLYCTNDLTFCRQYPCPSCSAVLSAVTKATNKKLQVEDTVHNGKKTTFYFTIKE
jgi:hypothetical protein